MYTSYTLFSVLLILCVYVYVNVHTPPSSLLTLVAAVILRLPYNLFYSPSLFVFPLLHILFVHILPVTHLLFIHHNLQLINCDPEFRLGCGTSNQAQAVMEIKEHSSFSNTPMDPDEEVRWVGWQWVWPHIRSVNMLCMNVWTRIHFACQVL